jgi:RimJ/RimL family protein N-acetyltransferase
MIYFNFSDIYTLEDDMVLLRPLATEDIEHLYPFAINEPQLWKYSSTQPGGNRENMRRYIETALDARKNRAEYPFIVYDKHANSFAGSTRFYDIQLKAKTLQLGYTWYGSRYHGTGLNKHCKFLLLRFAFEQMAMERVEFRADNNNAKSIAAMRSIGCTVEGILRNNAIRSDGSRRDSIVLSILKSEWELSIKNNLLNKIYPS